MQYFQKDLLRNYKTVFGCESGDSGRIQIKFRQVDGKTPYSKQVHFENTRRHSVKNNNRSAESGHVRYSVSEFDYVCVVLCHIFDGYRTKYTNWSYSLIESYKLEDVNNQSYCLPNIPSALLLKNKWNGVWFSLFF